VILYRVDPPSAEGTVHFYRQKLVDSGLDLDWAIPLQALPFAYRSVANNSLSRISLRSSGVYTFAFVDGFLCFDGLLSAATAPGRTQFLFDSSADVAGQYRLTPTSSKCLFLMNPNETERALTTRLQPGDAVWVDEQRKLTGNQTVVLAREGTEEESPVLLRLAMGGAPGARSVSVSVTAEAGGRAKAFFLGVLQEDFPVHRLESTADTVLLVDSEVAIAAMAVALAVVLIGSCVRYGWWDDWRASRGAVVGEPAKAAVS
jgi:hypothetical protein